MKKQLEIKIPAGLTPEKEAYQISKKLTQKALSGNGRQKDHKRIGDEVDFSYLETTIKIIRVPKEKTIEMLKCNVCGHDYQNNMAKYYWHNIGGIPKRKAVCSKICIDTMKEILGNRMSIKKREVRPAFFF